MSIFPRLVRLGAIACILAGGALCVAQPVATIVADLRSELDGLSDTSILDSIEGSGHVWFFARGRDRRYTLYVADGSSPTPRPIHVNAFQGPPYNNYYDSPVSWTVLGDRLFYAVPRVVDDHAYPVDLFVADAATGTHTALPYAACTNCTPKVGSMCRLDAGHILFAASTGTWGALFISDGTPSGTIALSPASTLRPDSIYNMFPAAGRVFFRAGDGSGNPQLWASDGTSSGTVRLMQNQYYDDLTPLLDLNGKLLFKGTDRGLGISDGTVAGTAYLAPTIAQKISPGAFVYGPGNAWALFGASQNGVSRLWRSDGTAANTAPIFGAAVDPAEPTSASIICPLGSGWLVREYKGGTWSLFRTDGTAAGTVRIPGSDGLLPYAESSAPLDATRTVFASSDGLYVTDGTGPGTFRLSTIRPANINRVQAGSGLLVIPLYNGIWRTDGTVAGTYQLAPRPANFGGLDDATTNATITPLPGGRTFLQLSYGQSALPLSTDGTVAGTSAVAASSYPIYPRQFPYSGLRHFAHKVGERVLFLARDFEHGEEIWSSDGTAAGTGLVLNAAADVSNWLAPKNFRMHNDRLYFTGTIQGPYYVHDELFAVDGTPGASDYGGILADALARAVPIAGGRLAFSYNGDSIIYSIDPAVGRIAELHSFPSDGLHTIGSMAAIDGGRTLVFDSGPPRTNTTWQLYGLDTLSGVLSPIWAHESGWPVENLASVGGRAYFSWRYAIMSTDGATVVRHTNLDSTTSSDPTHTTWPEQFTGFGSRIAFIDGGGSVRMIDPLTGLIDTVWTAQSYLTLFPVGDHLVALSLLSQRWGVGVITTDGTAAGAFSRSFLRAPLGSPLARPPFVRLPHSIAYFGSPIDTGTPDLLLAPLDSSQTRVLQPDTTTAQYPEPPVELRGRALTVVHNPSVTRAWVRSFGEIPGDGTDLVGPLGPELLGWASVALAGPYRGRAYAVLYPSTSRPGEVWSMTGNPAGSRLVATIPVGIQISRNTFGFAGDRLYFPAIDETHGDELWSVPLPRACPADFDGDEQVGVADIFAMIGAFFAGDLGADADGNGVLAVADVFRFLNDWLAGCG